MQNISFVKDTTAIFDIKQLKVTSTAFQKEDMIPFKYSCDGANVNPPLNIEYIPEATNHWQ